MVRLLSRFRFDLGLVLSLATLALGVVGCGSAGNNAGGKSDLKRIIFLTNGNSPFFDTARAGLQKADVVQQISLHHVFVLHEPTNTVHIATPAHRKAMQKYFQKHPSFSNKNYY